LLFGAWYLYRLLGAAGVLGMFVLAAAMVVTRRLIAQAKQIEAASGLLNDRRVAAVGEVLLGITSIKLLGLGSRFVELVGAKRAEQLAMLWRRAKVHSLISMLTVGSLPFVSFIAFAVYGMAHGLDAEIIFTAIAVFKIIQRSMDMVPTVVANSTAFYVSFCRIEDYLAQPEVQPLDDRVNGRSDELGFDGARLVWDRASPFALDGLSVRFPRGALTVVGGPTGSGKSSLLSALIGEMELRQGSVLVPTAAAEGDRLGDVAGGSVLRDIAYVPQEPWLRNATIRDNILFGERFDQARYESAVHTCALGPDLAALLAGDLTEIGERGITLSGGQRQRIALARAVYSSRQTLLIDDCLSAVDAQTGRHILHECLLGQSSLMAGRTRLLVTHHMAMCLPHADYVV
ncbi:Transporter of the ATP-binding cassette (ABC), partial [Coemansia nantahalensis]